MAATTHPVYKDYEEQPYISPERNLEEWENHPERFHYGVIEKRQMVRLAEGVLPGDIVMLWRIHFDNFTNETFIPYYFEYRYGVNSDESIQLLLKLGFIEMCTATETIDLINVPVLKNILNENSLAATGKKADLLARIGENIPEKQLAPAFTMRRYKVTPRGSEVLHKYADIIKRHGPKSL